MPRSSVSSKASTKVSPGRTHPTRTSEDLSVRLDGSELHLGYSRVNSYLTCPLAYKFTYVDGIRAPSGVPARRGTAYHGVLEGLLKYKMAHGKHVSLDKTERFAIKWAQHEELTDAEIDRVVVAARFYHKEMYPIHQPLFVEEDFDFVRAGVRITGRIDYGGMDGLVIDHKFSYDTWAESRAAHGPQPIVYQWAMEDQLCARHKVTYSGFAYNIIRLYPAPVIQEIKINPLTKEKSAWWEEQIIEVARGIKYGIFPAKTSEGCKRCDHKKRCKPAIYKVQAELFGGASTASSDDDPFS